MIWKIVDLECYPHREGRENVVFTAHWTLAHEEDGFSSYAYGSAGLTLDPAAPFTPLEKLTEADVIAWVKDAIGAEQVKAIEAGLTQQIDAQRNPQTLRPALPWAARISEIKG